MIKNALFFSVWDGGTIIGTPCKVNTETMEVFDIVTVECDVDMCEEEYIEIDGERYPVFQEDNIVKESEEYWYE